MSDLPSCDCYETYPGPGPHRDGCRVAQALRDANNAINSFLFEVNQVAADSAHVIRQLQAENERLRANAGAAYSQLMNLQPHIESCCLPGKQSYIDDHVDVAMKLLENEDE